MTIQEAIGQLKCNVEGDYINLDDLEAFNLAIPALEKQIPKKVNNLEIFSDIGACVPKTKSGNCPICNNFMIGEVAHCKECGQALDWSDTE